MEQAIVCLKCKLQIPESSTLFFCPNCGAVLKQKPPLTSVGKQIGLYLISFLLPPFGLWPAFKYLKQPDSTSKRIGWIAITLTVLSIILSVWATVDFFQKANEMMGAQLNQYQNLGY